MDVYKDKCLRKTQHGTNSRHLSRNLMRTPSLGIEHFCGLSSRKVGNAKPLPGRCHHLCKTKQNEFPRPFGQSGRTERGGGRSREPSNHPISPNHLDLQAVGAPLGLEAHHCQQSQRKCGGRHAHHLIKPSQGFGPTPYGYPPQNGGGNPLPFKWAACFWFPFETTQKGAPSKARHSCIFIVFLSFPETRYAENNARKRKGRIFAPSFYGWGP